MSDSHLAHMVFFTLKDASAEAQQHMVDQCVHYLKGHDGEVYFSAGVRGVEFKRPVNDLEYHVAVHVVFENKAAHDAYQVNERHQEFIATNNEQWENVRIFDTYVS